ncbi:hypothetical protein [Methanolobus sp. WCC4]|uniref:hypothetical protein n=1 Tax=Methanolobus sp. WCC4 TaxID=3125784 RepID=UPI0030F7C3FB
MEPMDIYTFGKHLSSIEVDNIYETMHFRARIEARFGEGFIEEIYSIIFEKTPVGILQQNGQKFKVLYRYSEKYDISVIIGIKEHEPIKFSLVTCFKESSGKRVREDERTQDQA